MAWMGQEKKCGVCQKKYTPIHSAGSVRSHGCPHCAEAEATRKEREHFIKLDALSLEERIRKIENWIYNYKVPRDPRSIKY